MQISKTNSALNDIFEIADFIDQENSKRIADEFLIEVDRILKLILSQPEMGEIWEPIPSVRKKLIVRFKVLIFYKYDLCKRQKSHNLS